MHLNATLLSHKLQRMITQLHYSRQVYSKGLLFGKNFEYEDELNNNITL